MGRAPFSARRLRAARGGCLLLILLAVQPAGARAQGSVPTRGGATATQQDGGNPARTFRLIVRADAFLARVDAFQLGVGASTDLGSYVRLDGVLAGGVRGGGSSAASGRAEVIGRFLLDPFRQARWGFYAGGGLVARHDEGPGTTGYLTLLAGAELPGSGRTLPAVEIGIGGGTRLAVVVRRGRPNRR